MMPRRCRYHCLLADARFRRRDLLCVDEAVLPVIQGEGKEEQHREEDPKTHEQIDQSDDKLHDEAQNGQRQ